MIDWACFDKTLNDRLCERTGEIADRVALTSRGTPLLAHEVLAACSDDPVERNEITGYEWWPASVLELLEQHYWPEQWFLFYWDSIGPTSWASSLWLIHASDGSSLVGLLHEDQPFYLLARVRPDDDPLLLSRLFRELVNDNGRGFGVDLFGSLPTETTNWFPNLVRETVVKQAYWHWIEWAETTKFDSWLNLEQSLAIHDLEPDPIARSQTVLADLPDLRNREAIGEWLHERDQESAGFPDHSKQALLDWYFLRRYSIH